jgi:hypothetical protein
MYVWRIWASLVPEQLGEFNAYLVFKSSSFIGQGPVNMSIKVPKIGASHIGPETQNCDFLENDCNNFYQISVIHSDYLSK